MRAKLSVLRACRRVLKPGGKIAFYTIFIAPGASEEERRRILALEEPSELASRAAQDELLRLAGFSGMRQIDSTSEFLKTARAWWEARKHHATDLIALEGEKEFAEGQANRETRLAAIEAGLLRRALFIASRPPGRS